MDKKSLRAQCLAGRLAIVAEQVDVAADQIASHLLHHLQHVSHTSVIAGYMAVRGELNLLPALTQLAKRGHLLCLPVIHAPHQPLQFRRWHPGQPLVKERHDIEVPPASAPVLEPDILLAPLLGFDAAGHRLGYGGGYYDRTLQALRAKKPIAAIGIGYHLQQVALLPVTAHDERLDAVITEQGTIRFTPDHKGTT